MPLYEYICPKCGKTSEKYCPIGTVAPMCCGEIMIRRYGKSLIKVKYPLWVDRIEDIHKAQEQRGERLRFVHPREVRAT